MNKTKVFELFNYCVKYREGFKRTNQDQAICERALQRFKGGCLRLDDCYKRPSDAKISAYLECESLSKEHGYFQVCSSVLGYNCNFFSWVALWADCKSDYTGEVTIYLRFDTISSGKLIKVCRVPFDWVR